MSPRAKASIVLVLSAAGAALAQPDVRISSAQVQGAGGEPTPAWVAAQALDPEDPRVKEYAARQKVRVNLERELGKIRADYFRAKKTDIRQAGILKLKQYTDPVIFPGLYKMFTHEGDDVRTAMLDHLADQRNDEADTVIAWGAVFDKDAKFRGAATERLTQRLRQKDGKQVSGRIQSVVAQGLGHGDDSAITAAAQLAQTLDLYQAIPMLINAQIGGGQTVTTGGGGGDDSSLAWIMVGTQQSYVADLTPVVGDSAVAFDPTVAVVTEGVVLRVIDAVVFTYRVEVNNALIGLSTKAWGKSTHEFGWDNRKWVEWYRKDFKPFLAAKEARERAEAEAASRAARKSAPVPIPG